MICKICNTEMSLISHNKEDQIESYGCDTCGEIFKKKCSIDIKKYITDQYLIDSKRTANLSPTIMKRLQADNMLNILHACFGLTTEVGEFVDQIKKHIFYGTELDLPNLKEEMGDVFFYFADVLGVYGWTF